jgi:hypothetical protein
MAIVIISPVINIFIPPAAEHHGREKTQKRNNF